MLCNSWKFRTKRHTVPPETEQTDMSWGKERLRMGSYFHVSGTRNEQTSITLIWMLTAGCCSSCGHDGMGLFFNTAGSAGPTDATLDQVRKVKRKKVKSLENWVVKISTQQRGVNKRILFILLPVFSKSRLLYSGLVNRSRLTSYDWRVHYVPMRSASDWLRVLTLSQS